MIGIWLQWDFNGISCEAGFKCSTWMKILRFYHLYKRLSDGHPAKFLWNLIWQWKNHGHQRVEWKVYAMCKINSPVQSPDRHITTDFFCVFLPRIIPKRKWWLKEWNHHLKYVMICQFCCPVSLLLTLPNSALHGGAPPRVTIIWSRSEVAIICKMEGWMLQSWNMIIEPAKKKT